jgi:hypothetical protein
MACGSFFKWWIYTSAILILLIGIIIEIIFIVLARGRFAEATESKTRLIVIGTIFLAVMLIIVIIGCCGVSKQNTCLLITYAIITGCLFAGLWVVFGYMKKGKSEIHDDIEEICSGENKGNFIGNLDKIYENNLNAVFCTNLCRCKGDIANFPGVDYIGADISAEGTASMVTECSKNPVKDERKALLSFLGWLEEEKDCSGICTKQKYYYFSDVARGPPPKPCKDPLLDYIDSKS